MRPTVLFTRACIALCLATMPLSEAMAVERPELHFDDRKWKIGNRGQKENQRIVEFVLEGETVENWTELITVQLSVGLTAPIAQWISVFKAQMEKDVKPSKWNVIRSSHDDAVLEWEVKGDPSMPDQYEIDRLIQGKDGFYIIHYTTKNTGISPTDRSNWIGRLDAARIITE